MIGTSDLGPFVCCLSTFSDRGARMMYSFRIVPFNSWYYLLLVCGFQLLRRHVAEIVSDDPRTSRSTSTTEFSVGLVRVVCMVRRIFWSSTVHALAHAKLISFVASGETLPEFQRSFIAFFSFSSDSLIDRQRAASAASKCRNLF